MNTPPQILPRVAGPSHSQKVTADREPDSTAVRISLATRHAVSKPADTHYERQQVDRCQLPDRPVTGRDRPSYQPNEPSANRPLQKMWLGLPFEPAIPRSTR